MAAIVLNTNFSFSSDRPDKPIKISFDKHLNSSIILLRDSTGVTGALVSFRFSTVHTFSIGLKSSDRDGH